jgi:hypothetical protein
MPDPVVSGKITTATAAEEFPIIREQDLAMVLADWVRLKARHDDPNGEPDALDLTMLVGELSTGLHAQSLMVILRHLPDGEQWLHLRRRLEQQLRTRRVEDFGSYDARVLPIH